LFVHVVVTTLPLTHAPVHDNKTDDPHIQFYVEYELFVHVVVNIEFDTHAPDDNYDDPHIQFDDA